MPLLCKICSLDWPAVGPFWPVSGGCYEPSLQDGWYSMYSKDHGMASALNSMTGILAALASSLAARWASCSHPGVPAPMYKTKTPARCAFFKEIPHSPS